jgi:hypothetical protein
MAALTATMFTQTIESRVIEGKHRRNRVRLTFSNGGAFYPSSGGVPLPTTMGMKRNIDYVIIVQQPYAVSGATGRADSINWHYVVTEHSIHGYWESNVTSTATSVAGMHRELPTVWKPSNLSSVADGVAMVLEVVGW